MFPSFNFSFKMLGMWKKLPQENKNEYKKMILAFASLTEMFDQKGDNEEDKTTSRTPVINSKYQEKVFQMAFGAHGEDKGNTSYDASLSGVKKYVIGIKTFGYKSGDQKVAQFKANEKDWLEDVNLTRKNKFNPNNTERSEKEINDANKEIYKRIAIRLAELRNLRIKSSIESLEGFEANIEDDIESVYHVLMPRVDDGSPLISVGETSYDMIDLDSLEIIGCTSKNKPENFYFRDKNHRYKFTPADSQLLMNFNNSEIVLESWAVKYADNAYAIFANIANTLYREEKTTPSVESFCWLIPNKKGEVEQFSGFNGFYGVGSKMSRGEARKERIKKFEKAFSYLEADNLKYFIKGLNKYLLEPASCLSDKKIKVELRKEIINYAQSLNDPKLQEDLKKILFRPVNEMYIPIPNSKKFHKEHPFFFIKDGIKFNGSSLAQHKKERRFKLIFEPSGNAIEVYIAEDNGKAIESSESMGKLGEWILRKVFQLGEFEPLTEKRLNEIGINGIRLEKYSNSDDIHLHFIWIDPNEPPPDEYWE